MFEKAFTTEIMGWTAGFMEKKKHTKISSADALALK